MNRPRVEYNLAAGALRRAQLNPERTALVFEGQRWTYAELRTEVDRVAKGMMALGVEPGDRVALWMTNRPEWIFAIFGLAKCGACVVPLNTRYRTDDIGYTLAQSRSSMLVTLDRSGPVSYSDILAEAIPELSQPERAPAYAGFDDLRTVVMLGEALPQALTWQAALDAGVDVTDAELEARADAVDPDSLMLICYTSGTTASPKGVMHTHIPIRNTYERAQLLGMTFSDVHLNYLPLFHIYGYSEITMVSVLTGATQVLMDAFDAEVAPMVSDKSVNLWKNWCDGR